MNPLAVLQALQQNFNAFVQKCSADVGALQQLGRQLVAGHNELDKKLDAVVQRQLALEQGCRQLAQLISQLGAGAVAGGPAGPSAQVVDAAPAVEPVSATGIPLEAHKTMSPEDQKIWFGGDE